MTYLCKTCGSTFDVTYYPGDSGVRTFSNGDPGYPPTSAETDPECCPECDTEVDIDKIIEDLNDAYDADLADREEQSEQRNYVHYRERLDSYDGP